MKKNQAIKTSVINKLQQPTIDPNPYDKFGAGAESKLRLEEVTAANVMKTNASYYAPPVPEGRMRAQETSRYVPSEVKSQDFERRHMKSVPEPRAMPERKVMVPDRKVIVPDRKPVAIPASTAPKSVAKNPFDDDDDSKDDYDESKNPFADDDEDVSSKPAENSNYDKQSSNPFGDYDSN